MYIYNLYFYGSDSKPVLFNTILPSQIFSNPYVMTNNCYLNEIRYLHSNIMRYFVYNYTFPHLIILALLLNNFFLIVLLYAKDMWDIGNHLLHCSIRVSVFREKLPFDICRQPNANLQPILFNA